MSRRRRTSAAEPPFESPAQDRLRPLWLGGLTALFVAMPILPSETVLFGGSIAVVMLLWWLLCVAWGLHGAVRGELPIKLGMATWALFAFLIWHSTSAIVMSWRGNPRASCNMLWLWVMLGMAFFLARQLIVAAAERRAVVSVMIGLAVSFSALGYYQYFHEMPATRLAYEKDPEKVLRNAGIEAPPGTPERKLFEDRLYSTEPLATFALTNSLAGLLSPWLIVGLGILFTQWKAMEASRRGAIVATVLISGCWVLTKSRTAWLATIAGIALLLVYGRRAGWRPDGRIVAVIGAAALVLPFLAAVVGGLDRLVVLESSKSFLYRLQYWRSTATLIGDHPWFGCGPGNFQQYYTAYKVPEASETIAEPHNFLLEIWATAGTPALVLLLGIFAGVIWQVWQADGKSPDRREAPEDSQRQASSELGSVRAIYWGALAGGLLGYVLCAYLEGYSPSPGLLVGFIPAFGIILLLHHWVIDGRLPSSMLAIAIIVMLVNFLAAGGISFAGVAQSLWLLTALWLNEKETEERTGQKRVRKLGRWPAVGLTAATGVLLTCFHQTAYSPITEAETHVSDANARHVMGQPAPALSAIRLAAEADPYSPEPWMQIAEVANKLWLQTGERAFEEQFREATRETLARNSRSSHAQTMAGHRWLVAYHQFQKREYLDEAIVHYRIAVELYPNYNLGHAHLAWALHLAGDPAAGKEADEAFRLDSLTPHEEQKLSQQPSFDPRKTAEQMLLELRKR